MYEIFYRQKFGLEEILIVLDIFIPFRQLAFMVPEGDVYYVYNRQGRDSLLETAVLNLLKKRPLPKDLTDGYMPIREETRYPSLVPVCMTEWNTWTDADLKRISILSSDHGWDFYDVNWLMHKWEAGLSFFDDDILYMNIPVYPTDLFNRKVEPCIIIKETDRYIGLYGKDMFCDRFFALSLLTQEDVGRHILDFFYEYHEKMTVSDIMEALYKIYTSLPINHYYRDYIFKKNFSVIELHRQMRFKISLFVSQYLSYHGMYISKDFYIMNRKGIGDGVFSHIHELKLQKWKTKMSKQECSDSLDQEFQLLYSILDEEFHWIGKNHIKKFLLDSTFWKHIFESWDTLSRRNIFLWESSSFRYSESQTNVGYEFKKLLKPSIVSTMNKEQQEIFHVVFFSKKIKKKII